MVFWDDDYHMIWHRRAPIIMVIINSVRHIKSIDRSSMASAKNAATTEIDSIIDNVKDTIAIRARRGKREGYFLGSLPWFMVYILIWIMGLRPYGGERGPAPVKPPSNSNCGEYQSLTV